MSRNIYTIRNHMKTQNDAQLNNNKAGITEKLRIENQSSNVTVMEQQQ